MKASKTLTALALPALILGNGLASAKTNSQAIEACAGAIARHIETTQGQVPRTRIAQEAAGMNLRLNAAAVFELDAFDPGSNEVVGRFSCLVNERAKVRRLVTLPLDAPDAEDRGRS